MQIDLVNIGLNQETIDRLADGVQDFGPRTPFSDWRDAANELARESEEEVAERALELYNEVDPGRGRAAARDFGTGSTRDLAFREIVQEPAAESWMQVYEKEGLPPYKVDPASGEKVYINTPPGVNLIDLLEGEDREEYLAKKKAGFDERLTKTPYNVETGLYGSGAGNYGTRVIPEELNNFQKALSSPIVSALAAFIPGGSLALVAGKTLAGVDVSPVEIALAAHGAYGDYAKSIANKAIKETGGQAVGPTIDVELTTAEQQAAAIDAIDIAGDPSAFEGVDIAGLTPEVAAASNALSPLYETYDKIIEDVGSVKAFNELSPSQLESYIIKHGGSTTYRELYPYLGGARSLLDIPDEIISLAGGVGNVPDFIMETTMEDYTRPPSLRTETTVDISNLEDTPVTETQPTRESFFSEQQPDGGGGGGAAGGTGLAGGATTTTSGSVSVTPNIDYTAPGAVTSSLFGDFINTAAAVAGADTSTSPITPVATTAPATESTQTTTTEPTSILENTTDDTTTAPDTTGGGSTGGVEDPVSTGGAEGAGAEGGASGGADDGSGTGGDGASGQEGGDDTAGDGTTAGGGAGDAGDAEGAGGGTGTGDGTGTGQGTGSGEGTGDGSGSGDGSGDGSGAGMGGGGAGGIGRNGFLGDFVIPQLSLADVGRSYEAPPTTLRLAENFADEIKNLRSFGSLSPQQVNNRLSTLGNPLLQEIVMNRLYGGGQQ